MDKLSAGREPEPPRGADNDEELLRDLLIRMTERPHAESLTEVLRLAMHRQSSSQPPDRHLETRRGYVSNMPLPSA
jgi:hypothetical protein